MKVLVIGSGGREHAIAYALNKSSKVSEIHAIPGNPGIAKIGTCHPGSVEDLEFILNFFAMVKAYPTRSRFSPSALYLGNFNGNPFYITVIVSFTKLSYLSAGIGTELSEDLFRKNIVDSIGLRSSAGNVYGGVAVELFHNSVTEGDPELADQVFVQLSDPSHISVADGVSSSRPCRHSFKLCGAYLDGRVILAFKGLAFFIQAHNHSAVVYLVADGKGGVVVVDRSHEPHIVGKAHLAVF